MSREKSGGLSVSTLLIASASAAAAAMVVPLVWGGGGVVAAAVTPVIVALVSEALRHPVERVSTVGVWRKTPQGTAIREPAATRDFDPLDPHDQHFEVDPGQPDDPFGLREPERPHLLRRRNVVLALVTGALAFGIAAVVVTASELAIFGDSVSRPSRTTFFGGEQRAAKKETPTPTPTPAAEEEGATPTPEATEPTPTPSPAAREQATPTPTAAAPGATPAAPTPAPTP